MASGGVRGVASPSREARAKLLVAVGVASGAAAELSGCSRAARMRASTVSVVRACHGVLSIGGGGGRSCSRRAVQIASASDAIAAPSTASAARRTDRRAGPVNDSRAAAADP